MPPFSKNLAEEGVLIRNFKLVDAGQSRLGRAARAAARRARIPRAASRTTWPTSPPRWPPTTAARAIWRGWSSATRSPVVEAYMRHIQAAAERKMRAGAWRGCPTAGVTVRRSPGRRHADRRGDHDRRRRGHDRLHRHRPGRAPGNLNANRAIVTAAVMYVLRLLIDEDIPLNQGVLAPVEIVVPPECLLNPPERARAGGLPGGGRRQRRDVAARGRRAAGRAGPGGGQPGDDEQPALRRRDVRLLRNDLRRRGRDARRPTAPTPCTRT